MVVFDTQKSNFQTEPDSSAPDEPEFKQITPSRIRVFLADDHTVVREGVKNLVNAQPDMTVVGEAENGEQGWRFIRALLARNVPAPDVIVLDISMPGWNGAEAAARIRRSWPQIKTLMLSMHEDRTYLRAALEAGATGYILKRSAGSELVRAIRAVAEGVTYLDPALTATMVETLVRGNSVVRKNIAGGTNTPLSEREDSVLRLIAQGYANKEIAAQLQVSVKTVETYKARSMEKLGLNGRTDIVRYALSKGWLT